MPKKKFDTNPLDPEFPKRVTEAQKAEPTSNLDAKTKAFPQFSVTEDETRRFNPREFTTYSPPFTEKQSPAAYQTAKLADMNRSNSHKVESIGLPENILTALPYIPFYIGLIAGLVILFFVPKSEAKVRFHAAQGLAAHLAILIISAILGTVGNITDFADFGNTIFQVVTTVMLIIWAIKAWQGKPVHIESVDSLTEWLEEKIKPRN